MSTSFLILETDLSTSTSWQNAHVFECLIQIIFFLVIKVCNIPLCRTWSRHLKLLGDGDFLNATSGPDAINNDPLCNYWLFLHIPHQKLLVHWKHSIHTGLSIRYVQQNLDHIPKTSPSRMRCNGLVEQHIKMVRLGFKIGKSRRCCCNI